MTGSRSTRWASLARGFVLSAASLFVASMSHVAVGGHAPGALALTLALAFSLLFCTAIAGRVLSLPRLVAGVAFSQLLLHLLFSLDGGYVGGSAIMPTGHHAVVMALTVVPGASGMTPGGDPGMWVAHGIAGIVTVALIRWGHLTARAVRAGLRPFVALVRRTLHTPQPRRAAASVCAALRDVLPPCSRAWSSSLSRRGPPLLSY